MIKVLPPRRSPALLASLFCTATHAETGERPAAQQTMLQAELQRSAGSLELIAPFVTHEEAALRQRAGRALAHLRDPLALPTLKSLLTDDEASVRAEAAFALGQLDEGAPALRQALQSEGDEQVQAALLRALGRVGQLSDLDLLKEKAGGSSRVVAQAACHGLGRLGVRRLQGAARPDIIALLLELQGRHGLRRPASYALARLGAGELSEAQSAALLQALSSQSDATARAWLARAAAAGLDEERWRSAARSLVGDHVPAVRIALARGLATRADDDGDLAEALLGDDERSVRIAALHLVAALDWQPALAPTLEALLGSEDEEQQALALSILVAAGALSEAERWLEPSVAPASRAAVAAALQDRERLLQLVRRDPTPAVRSAAAMGLLTHHEGAETLRALLEQDDPLLAAMAAEAMAEAPDADGCSLLLERLAETEDRDLLLEGLQALVASASAERAAEKSRPGAPSWLPGKEAQARLASVLQRTRARPDLALQQAAAELGELLDLGPFASAQIDAPSLDAIDDLLSARVRTERGEFVICLYANEAPVTVWRWAQRAEEGFYDGLIFHRIVPDFVVQGGDPRGDGYGGPGYAIPDEFNPLPYEAFSVGMATSGPDSGGSQWFVTLSPQPHLTGSYTLFGQVCGGQDSLRRLRQGDRVEQVTVERRSRP